MSKPLGARGILTLFAQMIVAVGVCELAYSAFFNHNDMLEIKGNLHMIWGITMTLLLLRTEKRG